MPTYEYVCSKCDQHLEVYQSFSEEPLKRHSGCGGKLSKVLGSVGIVLKGSGFYRTDNASSSRRSAERSDSSSSNVGVVVGLARTRSPTRRRPSKSDAKPAEVRQEERHQEVGLAARAATAARTRGVTATPTPPPGATTEPGGSPMLRRSPRTALAWAAAAVVAVVTAATVVSLLTSLRHQDEAYGALHPVAVARHDLAVGTRVDAGRPHPPPDPGRGARAPTRSPRPQAVGRVVRVPLLRGATVTARHLAATGRDGLGGVVPAGRRAVRLVVEHGLRPAVGDLVDVLATFDPETIGDGRPHDRGRARGHRRRGRRRRPTPATPSRSRCSSRRASRRASRSRRGRGHDQPRAGAAGVGDAAPAERRSRPCRGR